MAGSIVSIVMPCYGMGRFVGQALQGIASQSLASWELIAVDDCGPDDGTVGLVEDFARQQQNHKVQLVRHNGNRGVSAARNTGLDLASGDYIAFLDPDDFWGPGFLAELVHYMDTSGSDVVYSLTNVVSHSGADCRRSHSPSASEVDGFPKSLYVRNFIVPSCALVRKSSIPSARPFDESPELQHVEDWDFWLRLAFNNAKFLFIDKPNLCFYRQHAGGGSQVSREIAHRRARALVRKHAGRVEFIEGQLEALENEFQMLTSSLSWRIGWAITMPARYVIDKFLFSRSASG